MVTNLSSSRASLTRTSLLAVIFNSRVQTMPFHWPVSYCFSEHTCRPSHTTQPWCAFGCTSRKILNTIDICLTAARGQMRAELMRTRGSRALPTCAASRNRPIALPGELVCGRLNRASSHDRCLHGLCRGTWTKVQCVQTQLDHQKKATLHLRSNTTAEWNHLDKGKYDKIPRGDSRK